MVTQLMAFKILVCGLTDVGLVRNNNEDVWGEVPEHNFYILADGMGGHQAGEIASHEAVNQLCKFIKKTMEKQKHPKTLTALRHTMETAIQTVNESIYRMSRTSPDLKGMGTTLCTLHIIDEGLVYANVGDSRIYRLRDQQLDQLTQDHSLLRELVDMGQISEQSSTDFLYKNILTKAIGTEPTVEPYVGQADVALGDIYLLCTDGLTDLLQKEDIEAILNKKQPITKAAKELITVAKTRGGHDNVTVVLVKIDKHHAPSKDLSR